MADNGKKTIGLRLSLEQVALLDEVVARVRVRNQYMDQSKVLKEIIGFEKRRFVTDEDMRILKGQSGDEDSDTTIGSEDERIEAVRSMRKFVKFEGKEGEKSNLG